MFGEHSYSRRLGRWLEKFGFTDDPFAVYEADQERPYLHYFFVDRPYLHDILGNPARPQSAFLMAGRGSGKTATREMVAYECTHGRLRRRALAVQHYDFAPLLEQVQGDPVSLNARHHVHVLVRSVLKALAEDVPPTYFDLLEQAERALLASYVSAFADPISQLKLAQIVTDAPTQLDWVAFSPIEILQTLAQLVTHLGQSSETRYQALYILIDRVDETAAGPEGAVSLLKSLVREGPLLEMPNVAFKFFLSLEVGDHLKQATALRPDRLCLRTITWDDTALRDVVEQRLSYYSQGKVVQLKDLCTTAVKNNAMERLIRVSGGSPRTLLRLCGALIRHHVSHRDDTLFDLKDLSEAIEDFKKQLEVEHTMPVIATRMEASVATLSAPPPVGLYLDESGHVWKDSEPITPPLSPQEFILLKTLYRQAPEIVSHEALIEAVWPPSGMSSETTHDEQNLRKLVDRLRKRLEPDTLGQSSRFIQSARGRGYWLKLN